MSSEWPRQMAKTNTEMAASKIMNEEEKPDREEEASTTAVKLRQGRYG